MIKLLGYFDETKLATPIRRQQALSSVAQSRISGLGGFLGRVVVIPVFSGGGLPHLDERHREQIDRRGQADAARRLDGTRQIACQLLEVFSPGQCLNPTPPIAAAYTATAPLVLISSALEWIVAKFPMTFTTARL